MGTASKLAVKKVNILETRVWQLLQLLRRHPTTLTHLNNSWTNVAEIILTNFKDSNMTCIISIFGATGVQGALQGIFRCIFAVHLSDQLSKLDLRWLPWCC